MSSLNDSKAPGRNSLARGKSRTLIDSKSITSSRQEKLRLREASKVGRKENGNEQMLVNNLDKKRKGRRGTCGDAHGATFPLGATSGLTGERGTLTEKAPGEQLGGRRVQREMTREVSEALHAKGIWTGTSVPASGELPAGSGGPRLQVSSLTPQEASSAC